MNPLLALNQRDQFVWLDHISRSLITGGVLHRLIEQDSLGGVTSNPTIFDKAIAGSTDYDSELRRLLDAERNIGDRALVERLIVDDIQLAADVLRPVYDHSDGANGFVSLEVSPDSAHDTGATVAEARHLWQVVARPNVMIKVPATQAGVRAVEMLTADGINVNITLMFSLEHYEGRGPGLPSRHSAPPGAPSSDIRCVCICQSTRRSRGPPAREDRFARRAFFAG